MSDRIFTLPENPTLAERLMIELADDLWDMQNGMDGRTRQARELRNMAYRARTAAFESAHHRHETTPRNPACR